MQIRIDNGVEAKITFAVTQTPHFHEGLELLFLIGSSGGG